MLPLARELLAQNEELRRLYIASNRVSGCPMAFESGFLGAWIQQTAFFGVTE
jgi:hypothetical protein